jgi:NAD(P)H-nitrite reductase large subunit
MLRALVAARWRRVDEHEEEGFMRHLIIGTGPAGVVAAEHLRKLEPGSTITLIGDEPEPPYSRMAIPYYLVDQINERGTHLRKAPDHYERLGIELHRGRVVSVDPVRRLVALDGGGELGYERLLVATGARPARPPIPGANLPGVHPCWTLADARAILQRAQPGARVVLMGAGFIGCIILEALAARGTRLTVVEMENRMVPRMMNERAGGLIQRWCEAKGVRVLTGRRVEGIEPAAADAPLLVHLDGGEVLGAELVITATGVQPNLELLQGSGVAAEQGVLVNRRLESSVADIYAAGDVAQGLDFSTGQCSVQAIQPTAAEHGRLAASNMAGRTQEHRGSINMNVLDTMGLISSSFGRWMGAEGGESAELHDAERFRYLNLQFEDDRLVGASSVGLIEHVGVLRGLIQTRVRLGEWKGRLTRDPTRIMEAYLACTQPLGYGARAA